MTVLQAWLLFGIPALSLAVAMFVGRSRWRSLLGYLALAVGFGLMTVFHRPSGAIFGALLALVYASGRGGTREMEYDAQAETSHEAVEAGG